MASATKELLSGSTNGRPIKIAQSATPGTLIHTATSSSGVLDEVWLWATNTDISARKLTIELGGVTSPDDLIEVTIPAESGLYQILPGLVLNGGVVIRCFVSSANTVNVVGFVNRITN